METVIYHNPRCSKSRATLALLRDRGIEPRIVQYLDTPPDAAHITRWLRQLGLRPRQLMRQSEAIYRELNLADPQCSDAQLIAAMVANPILIERPIVEAGGRVAIGRPPENVLAILPQDA